MGLSTTEKAAQKKYCAIRVFELIWESSLQWKGRGYTMQAQY